MNSKPEKTLSENGKKLYFTQQKIKT